MKKIKAFKQKKITVRDYPDPSFIITIYGKSKSKFKLNDSVVIVNNDRVDCQKNIIIGFDKNGDPMLDNCPWCNTRGGYSDDYLIKFSVFKKAVSNLPQTAKNKINKEIQEHYKWEKETKCFKGINKTLERRIRDLYVVHNWNKIKKYSILQKNN
jgi:hypothetical protein